MKPACIVMMLFFLPLLPLAGQEGEGSGGQGSGEEDILAEAEALFEDEGEEAGGEPEAKLLSGYLESTLRLVELAEEPAGWPLLNANKLKLKLDRKVKDIQVHGEVNLLFYSGKVSYNLVDYLPDSFRPAWEPYRDEEGMSFFYEPEVLVAQAYTVLPVGPLRITLGRQPLALGTGYSWNPVDPLNKKNMLDPTYEVPAHDALKLSLPLPLNGEARAAGIVGEDFSSLGGFVSAKVHAFFDWELSGATLEYDVAETHRDWSAGLAFSGQIGEVGLHGEGAYFLSENPCNHFRWLLGGDYTFSFQNKVMAELYYNGAGEGDEEDYGAGDWLAYLSGQSLVLGRTYLFASTRQTLFAVSELSLSALASLTDASLTLLPELLVNFSERAELRLIYYQPLGEEGSEFGSFEPSAEIRLTGYF